MISRSITVFTVSPCSTLETSQQYDFGNICFHSDYRQQHTVPMSFSTEIAE